MSTLPGGRLAPQPPVTRVAAGGMAFLITASFAFLWAGIGVLEHMTENRVAIQILHRVVREPYREAVANALRTQQGSPIAVNADLVNFSVDRAAAADINIHDELARQRAAELYDNGLPKDPGVNERTNAIFPRSVLQLFTAHRHENLKTAKTAALIGLGTGFLLCAVIGLGASRFLLPGAASLLGYALLEYHIRLFNFWVEKNAPGGLMLRGRVRTGAVEPARNLLFITITLLVAGMVFRALRGPMRALLRGEPEADEGTAEAAAAPVAEEARS